jgi:hypothetical protein
LPGAIFQFTGESEALVSKVVVVNSYLPGAGK